MYVHPYVQRLQYLCSSFIYTHWYYIHIIKNYMPQLYDIPENKTCNVCTAYYIPYWPPTHELPSQIPMAQSIMEVRHTCSHGELPRPIPSMPYVPLPNRPFAVCHINNVISSKRTFLEYNLWSVSIAAHKVHQVT